MTAVRSVTVLQLHVFSLGLAGNKIGLIPDV